MSLVSQISTAFTSVATDMKRLRVYITGSSTGTLAGLTTTDKTSIVAALNEVKAASSGAPPAATTAASGVVELATDAETIAYADTQRAVTPSNLAAVFADKIDTNASLGTSNTKIPSQAAVKAYADARIAAADAFTAKGGINASTNPNYPAADAGDTYRVTTAGKIGGASGPNVEVGDLLQCWVDGTAAGTQAAVGANWDIIQVNIDGAVVGPASSVSGNLAAFSGTTGKAVADSGFSVDNDGALTANSATRVPTQAAVKGYAQPLDSDLTAIAALSTTAFGRSLLTQADAAAVRALISTYSQLELGDPTTDFASAYSAATV